MGLSPAQLPSEGAQPQPAVVSLRSEVVRMKGTCTPEAEAQATFWDFGHIWP
jgi:hypothetical protein